MDAYLFLEDLKDERTLSFIRRHNERLRGYLGNIPEEILADIINGMGIPQVYNYNPCWDRVYAVVRDSRGYHVIEIPGNRVVYERSNVVITGVFPSPDCSSIGIAYTGGSDLKVLEIVDSRGQLVDRVEGYFYDVVWRGGEDYYYVSMQRTSSKPSMRVILRDTRTGKEEVVWGSNVPSGHFISLLPVYDEGKILITVSRGWSSSSLYGGDILNPHTWRQLLDPGSPIKPVGYHRGRAYAIVYDDDNGTGRVVEIPVSKGPVRTIVRAHPRYPFEYGVVVGGILFLVKLVDAKARLEAYNIEGALLETFTPEKPSSMIFPKRWGSRALIMMESFSSPLGLYELPTLKPLYAAGEVLSLEAAERFATSYDGTRIHYFEVSKSGQGDVGAIVYGYGGFGVSLDPRYIGHLKPLLEEGFTYVMANLRGGREYGESWHLAGKGLNKMNVFEDYKAVVKHVKRRIPWTAGWGASNGGLLIGAVLVQQPDLLDAAIIGYPVLDMLRFHKLYIGSLWIDEYGDPEDPKYKEYLKRYSPIHNVKPANYPPTLIYTGLHDDRVHPGHALRFTALLEEVEAPVYLRVEEKAGHMGADITIKARESADIEAFILKVRGLR